MNKIKCYIYDNTIFINKDNKIISIKTDSIKNSHIIDSKLFIKKLKKNKIFNSIFTYNIILYLNDNINEMIQLYYEYIFQELNCSKVQIINTSSFFKNNTLIVNEECILIINDNYYRFNLDLLKYYIQELNISKLNIVSNNKIKHIKNCKYYYYNNSYINTLLN